MKFSLITLLTIMISYLSGILFPWWFLVPLLIILYRFFSLKPKMAFLSGFVAVFLLWGCLALVMDSVNNHLLSKKIAMIFLKDDQYGYLILITAFIGGLTGGLSSLTGSLAKAIIKKP